MVDIGPSARIAIVGSRDYPHPDKVREFVKQLAEQYGPGLTIVSGGARGVDTIAIDEAINCGLQIHIWRPNWGKHGKRAGLRRNYQIVADADHVVSFWDLESAGSAHTIRISRDRDKLWKVFGPDGEEEDLEDLPLD